jgi:hypothetical protein
MVARITANTWTKHWAAWARVKERTAMKDEDKSHSIHSGDLLKPPF